MSHPSLKRNSRRKARGVSGFEALEERLALTASAASAEAAFVATSNGAESVVAFWVAFIESPPAKPVMPANFGGPHDSPGPPPPPWFGFDFSQLPEKPFGSSVESNDSPETTPPESSPLAATQDPALGDGIDAAQPIATEWPNLPHETRPFVGAVTSFVSTLATAANASESTTVPASDSLPESTVAARDAVWAAVGEELDQDQLRRNRRSEIEDPLDHSFARTAEPITSDAEDTPGHVVSESNPWMRLATERASLESVLESLRELKSNDDAGRGTKTPAADSSPQDLGEPIEQARSAADRPEFAELIAGMIVLEASGDPNLGAGETPLDSLEEIAGVPTSAGPLPLRLIQDIDVGSYGRDRASLGQHGPNEGAQATADAPGGDGGAA